MKKNILIISNPFGYGPTGRAVAIAKKILESKKPESSIVFAGSGLCLEIFKIAGINIVEVDERDSSKLHNLFASYNNLFVISVLNRFAVRTAKDLGIPCVVVDELGWFWNEIPKELLLADKIYWTKMLGIEDKKILQENIHIVPLIVDQNIVTTISNKKRILFAIGGMLNPLRKSLPKEYLDLLCMVLNKQNVDVDIILSSSDKVIKYVREQIVSKNVKFLKSSYVGYRRELKKTTIFMSNGGEGGIMEAMAANIPVVSFLPSNYSQHSLLDKLNKGQILTNSLLWNEFGDFKLKKNMTELEYLTTLPSIVEKVTNNPDQMKRIINNFEENIKRVPNSIIISQKRFIKRMGTNGADIIASDLKRIWDY